MSKSKSQGAPFGKFIQQKEKGAVKKERIRQEKKVARKETQEFFAKKKAEARAQREQYRAQRDENAPGMRKRAGDDRSGGTGQGDWQSGRATGRKPVNKGYNRMSYMERKKKQAEKAEAGGQKAEVGNRKSEAGSRKSEVGSQKQPRSFGKPVAKSQEPGAGSQKTSNQYQASGGQRPATGKAPATGNKKIAISKAPTTTNKPATSGKASATVIPLNKFLSHSGISSRRDAAEIVKSGTVVVNGQVVTEPGFKVSPQDEVKVNGKKIQIRQTMVYILINKPKDYITTTEDPQGRKTVLDLIRNATTERVYPIGRLDRNTTGVLLLTNDGELAQKLSHPSYMVKKIYEVKLDKPLTKKDFDTIMQGVELEDGHIAPDALAYADPKDKSVVGIEIHSGRNRIVRRIFEHMGYDVRNLDRVMYANLTKKNVERGRWRFLSEKEVRLLKYLNASFTKNKPAARG